MRAREQRVRGGESLYGHSGREGFQLVDSHHHHHHYEQHKMPGFSELSLWLSFPCSSQFYPRAPNLLLRYLFLFSHLWYWETLHGNHQQCLKPMFRSWARKFENWMSEIWNMGKRTGGVGCKWLGRSLRMAWCGHPCIPSPLLIPLSTLSPPRGDHTVHTIYS